MALNHALGDGMLRIRQHFVSFPRFDYVAFMHDDDFVSDVLDHSDMLGYIHKGDAHLFLQFQKQIEDLRAHRHIQTVQRLIGNNDGRL